MDQLNAVNATQVGDRLRIARSSAGLTQEAAAAILGVARTTLVAIERGQRRVRPGELRDLSRLYSVSANQLLRPTAVHVDIVGRFRRARLAGPSEHASAEAVRLLNWLVSSYVELERMLDKPHTTHYPPEQPLVPGDITEQAEDAALGLRHRLGLGLAPIPDIVSLFELEMGIRIFVRPLDSTISGVFAYDNKVDACILLNSKHPRQRRAMTAAHEIGHFMSNRSAPDVYHEEQTSASKEERFAVAFGVALLMPAAAIRRRFREICSADSRFSARHLILLAHTFYVSPEAVCRRLEGLGLLPQGMWESLRERGFSAEKVREVLGDPAPDDTLIIPPRLSLLAAEAYQRGLISEGQLCEKLQMDRLEVRRLLDALDARSTDESGSL